MEYLMPWRKVDSKVWSDGWFLGLSDDARMLWLYLLTCEHWSGSLPGLFRCHSGTAAGDLGWDAPRYDAAFQTILDSRRVEFDKRTGLLWIVRAHEYCSEKTNTREKYWPGIVSRLPECPLRERAWEKIREGNSFFSSDENEDLDPGSCAPISHLPSPISNGHQIPIVRGELPDNSAESPGSVRDTPPVLMPDSRPMGEERDLLLEVCAEYGSAWRCTPPDLPEGDHLRRFLGALRSPQGGFVVLKQAVHGHHARASREGSKTGRELRHVVPPATDHGRTRNHIPDMTRVMEYAGLGGAPAQKKWTGR